MHVGWWVGKVWNACVGETHWRLGETSVLRGIARQVAIEHNVIYNTRNKGPFTHSARRKKPNRNAASCDGVLYTGKLSWQSASSIVC